MLRIRLILMAALAGALPLPALAETDACADTRKVLETVSEKLGEWGASTRKDHMAVLRIGTRAATAAAWASDLGWPPETASALAVLRDLKGSDLEIGAQRALLVENAASVAGAMPDLCPGSTVPDLAAYRN